MGWTAACGSLTGWGTWKGDHLLATLRDGWWRVLEMECLSPWEIYEGDLEEGLLYWGTRRICQVRL